MVLRPDLYQRLNTRPHFGGVIVANDGVPLTSVLTQKGDRKGRDVEEWGEAYRTNCPFCYDTRHRLYVNHRWGLKDADTGTHNWWLCHCFNEDCVAEFKAQMVLRTMVYDDASPGQADVLRAPVRVASRGPVTLPGVCVPVTTLPPQHVASRYLDERGFSHLAAILQLQYCEWMPPPPAPDQLAHRRLIIPMFMDDVLVTWQGRLIDSGGWADAPKYVTATGTSKSAVLYNFSVAKRSAGGTVVVVEGPTDVWRYGPEAVATLGKKASMIQLQLLSHTWPGALFLVDGDDLDAETKARQSVTELNRQGVKRAALVVTPPGTDPGAMSTPDVRRLAAHAARDAGLPPVKEFFT